MIKTAQKRFLRGFTLIELLIVIAILGILAAGVLVAVNPGKRQRQAKDANIKADIGSIATAAQAYYTSPGQGTYILALVDLVTNQDLKTLPKQPDGVTEYIYVTSPALCDGTLTAPCTEVAISAPLLDPLVTTNVWCWRSSTGRAAEVLPADCTAP
ncbi:MAG: type II secretion system protein [Candidatus Curtissbacteria bacterium]|nr:type II secretion system protein [Candidatus Curtissbacteria bacterium]